MNRKHFLKSLGATGLVTMLPASASLLSKDETTTPPAACILIPSETAGPFPLDLTENTYYFRQDIKESKTGVLLNVKLRVIGLSNCLPMSNLRVNIWHCDKDGLYSGYSQSNNQGQAGLTYLRGYQFTDAYGEVTFQTILPGWYTGRICHIHFQIYVSSSYAAISQLTFDIPTKNGIYANNPSLYTKGADPMTFNSDNIFSDGYQYQLASLTENSAGGYNAELELAINGSGTTGLGHIEKQNAKYFELGQNYPNPYSSETTIPLTLHHNSQVTIDLYDINGKKMATVIDEKLEKGSHSFSINTSKYNLPSANYVYQLTVSNADGVFKDHKMMTALKG